MKLTKMLDRAETIRTLEQPAQHIKQRIRSATVDLSRASNLASRLQVVNEAIYKLTAMAYELTPDGDWGNVDPVDGMLLIPAPWGGRGYRKWELRKREAEIAKRILRGRQIGYEQLSSQERERWDPPLYVYSKDTNHWYLNFYDYPNFQSAAPWLRSGPIQFGEWKKVYQIVMMRVRSGVQRRSR